MSLRYSFMFILVLVISPTLSMEARISISGRGTSCYSARARLCSTCISDVRALYSCFSILKFGLPVATQLEDYVLPTRNTDLLSLAMMLGPPSSRSAQCAGFLYRLLSDKACTRRIPSNKEFAAQALRRAAQRKLARFGGKYSVQGTSVIWNPMELTKKEKARQRREERKVIKEEKRNCAKMKRMGLPCLLQQSVSAPDPVVVQLSQGSIVQLWNDLLKKVRGCIPGSAVVTGGGGTWQVSMNC